MKLIIAIGAALLLLSWLFPPFVNITEQRYEPEVRTYRFGATIFSETNAYWHPDIPRLVLIDAAICVATGIALLVTKGRHPQPL